MPPIWLHTPLGKVQQQLMRSSSESKGSPLRAPKWTLASKYEYGGDFACVCVCVCLCIHIYIGIYIYMHTEEVAIMAWDRDSLFQGTWSLQEVRSKTAPINASCGALAGTISLRIPRFHILAKRGLVDNGSKYPIFKDAGPKNH